MDYYMWMDYVIYIYIIHMYWCVKKYVYMYMVSMYIYIYSIIYL